LIHPTPWPQQTWAADYTDAGKACIPKLRNWGLLCPFPGELFPHLTWCGLGRGQPGNHHTKSHPNLSNRLATIHQRYR